MAHKYMVNVKKNVHFIFPNFETKPLLGPCFNPAFLVGSLEEHDTNRDWFAKFATLVNKSRAIPVI